MLCHNMTKLVSGNKIPKLYADLFEQQHKTCYDQYVIYTINIVNT